MPHLSVLTTAPWKDEREVDIETTLWVILRMFTDPLYSEVGVHSAYGNSKGIILATTPEAYYVTITPDKPTDEIFARFVQANEDWHRTRTTIKPRPAQLIHHLFVRWANLPAHSTLILESGGNPEQFALLVSLVMKANGELHLTPQHAMSIVRGLPASRFRR